MNNFSESLGNTNKRLFTALINKLNGMAIDGINDKQNSFSFKVLEDNNEIIDCLVIVEKDCLYMINGKSKFEITDDVINNLQDYIDNSYLNNITGDDEDDDAFWNVSPEQKECKRNVFIFKEFDNQLRKIIKNEDDITALKSRIVSRLLTIEQSELKNWMYDGKHRVLVHTSSYTFVRARSPKGANIAKINRFFLCEGSQIKNDRFGNIGRNDIVLLSYMGEDMHKSDKYEPYADMIWEKIGNADVGDIDQVGTYTLVSGPDMSIVQKAYLLETGSEIHYVPLLDKNQNRILEENLKMKPPCVIYGSAGTGKTLLSEQLYEDLRKEFPDYKILYLTYMPRLKNQVYNELRKRNLHGIKAMHLYELLSDNLKSNAKLQTFEDFKTWFYEYSKTGVKTAIINKDRDNAIGIIYIFFRSYSFTDSMKNSENFKNSVKGECALSIEQKELIYQICKAYQDYIEKKRLFTDNNAATYIINNAKPKYDAIIVDEIQDLTQVQVQCILRLLKPEHKNMFFAFGDDNQSINPTLMRMSQAKSLVYKELGTTNEEISLNGSYRSTSYLINYINYINAVRQKTIGKDTSYNDATQTSYVTSFGNQSDKPAVITDENIIHKGLNDKNLFANNDIMVIVPTKAVAESLKKQYPHLAVSDDSTNILTIEETKGGEWNQVILYNFFSSSEDIWRDFSERYNGDKSGSLKSTIHRMYFNRFYVGLTRAAKKVIIAETNPLDSQTQEIFLPETVTSDNGTKQKVCLSYVTDYSDFSSFFENDFTHSVWHDRAQKLFLQKDYEAAIDCITKAIRSAKIDGLTEIVKEYETIKEQYQCIKDSDEESEISEEDIPYYIEPAFALNAIDVVRDIYTKANKSERLAWLDESNPEQIITNNNLHRNSYYPGEVNYFALKTIKAYHEIIKTKI